MDVDRTRVTMVETVARTQEIVARTQVARTQVAGRFSGGWPAKSDLGCVYLRCGTGRGGSTKDTKRFLSNTNYAVEPKDP